MAYGRRSYRRRSFISKRSKRSYRKPRYSKYRRYRNRRTKRYTRKTPVLLSVPDSFNKVAIKRSDYGKLKSIFRSKLKLIMQNKPLPRAQYKKEFSHFLHTAVKNNLLYKYYLIKNKDYLNTIDKAMHAANMFGPNNNSRSERDNNAPSDKRRRENPIAEATGTVGAAEQAAADMETGNVSGAVRSSEHAVADAVPLFHSLESLL